MDIRFLMKQAQQAQAKLQEIQKNIRAEGTAGGESVKIVLNGAKELVGVSISKDAMDPDDPSMLEDLIMAAFNDASAKTDEAMNGAASGMTSGLNIPGFKF
ncbi:MAG: YbaB/EbfC family nucleoid-associated protein [Holophagales bacterium]|jgi:DNA-binding YbaB/EbfC family protein|nr:YbaB/EbfC family nucleoid-associated protein [Holophagales bacterium]